MTTLNTEKNITFLEIETLDSFINKPEDNIISHQAYYLGFKHRLKVEFLKSFIV
jgi:hypothetical protein